jgi:hypothetical protein
MLIDYFQRFRRFVLALSGAHMQTLDLVPTERPRFESLGWAILVTSGLAVVSMWFALASAAGINGILAIPVAILWGFVIMGIDRWLVTSMPIDENRKWLIAIPRVLLAILLGTLISTPLVLRVFQSEIDAQIAKMQQSNYNAYLQTQKSDQLSKQITTYNTELQYLNTVINSHGAVTGNTAADPELVAYNSQLATLNNQLTSWTRLKAQYYQNYTCQKYGGADCPKAGVGPAADASLSSYNQAAAQVTKVQGEINHVQQEIQARDNQINDNSTAAQANRYQEALTQRPLIQNEYNTAVQQQNQLEQSYYAQNQASHGILVRLEALSQLSDSNFTVAAARFLLFLLFLVIECLPVTVKLLQKPGHYEAALQRAKVAESRDVDMFYSSWSGYRGSGAPSAPAFAPPVQQPQAGPRRAQQHQGDARQADPRTTEPPTQGAGSVADVFGIWRPTREMDRLLGNPEDERGTEVIDDADRPEFPPSENDPRAAFGWRRSSAPAQDASRQGDQDRSGQDRDEIAAQTSPDYAYSDSPTRADPTSQEFALPQATAYGPTEVSAHEALNQLDEEEQAPARSDGSSAGIALDWDDE